MQIEGVEEGPAPDADNFIFGARIPAYELRTRDGQVHEVHAVHLWVGAAIHLQKTGTASRMKQGQGKRVATTWHASGTYLKNTQRFVHACGERKRAAVVESDGAHHRLRRRSWDDTTQPWVVGSAHKMSNATGKNAMAERDRCTLTLLVATWFKFLTLAMLSWPAGSGMPAASPPLAPAVASKEVVDRSTASTSSSSTSDSSASCTAAAPSSWACRAQEAVPCSLAYLVRRA